MTLDEAIRHCEDVAGDRCGCAEDCVEEHRQLAEWLKELRERRAKDEPQTELVRVKYHCINCAENGSFKCTKCDGEMYFKRLEPKDEPQTEWHYDEQDATWYPYKHEDEPQTERNSDEDR